MISPCGLGRLATTLYRLAQHIAHTVRTVSPFVILSGAKNLVVAPARECLTLPLLTSRERLIFPRLADRECRTHPPIARKTRLNPKHITHPSTPGHSEAKPKNLVVGDAVTF